jgi:hypothetical protein
VRVEHPVPAAAPLWRQGLAQQGPVTAATPTTAKMITAIAAMV